MNKQELIEGLVANERCQLNQASLEKLEPEELQTLTNTLAVEPGVVIAYQRKKMINRELAEKTAEMVLGNTDQTVYAVLALEKRFNQFAQLELEEARKKSYNYLSRRGFSYEATKKAFEQLFIDMKED